MYNYFNLKFPQSGILKQMNKLSRIVCFVVVLFTSRVSSFTPYDCRLTTCSRFSLSSNQPAQSILPSNSKLNAGPAIADKPSTKDAESVSKEAEKSSKSSNSKGWAVRLFNDPMNKREFVARCLTEVCALSDGAAYQCMMRAHQFGVSVIGQYHLEMAELYRDQLIDHGLVVDMVPVDDDQ